jgi:hypothetical protein
MSKSHLKLPLSAADDLRRSNVCHTPSSSAPSIIASEVEALLAAKGPFCADVFAAGAEDRQYFLESKVLVIGAGGLGSELLRSLTLTGFRTH